MSRISITLPADYSGWLTGLKQRIQGARQRALLAYREMWKSEV